MSDVQGILGLAYRARRCVSGDEVIKSIQKQRAQFVIIAEDCGDNMRKKLMDKCSFYNVPYAFIPSEDINRAMGTSNRKSVAVLDKGFAKKLHTCLKG